jgi:hypothetical protein
MDMESSVAECAEKILDVLAKADKVNVLSVASLVGERSVIAYQAIGWLAHSKKIRYLQERSQVYLSRADPAQ